MQSWIKTVDKLPEMQYIDPNWDSSDIVLVSPSYGIVECAVLQTYYGITTWVTSNNRYVFKQISFWQPIYTPEVKEYET